MTNNDNDDFYLALSISFASHLLIIILTLLEFSSSVKDLIEEEQVITFEVLPISSKANVSNLQKQAVEEPKATKEEAKKSAKSSAEAKEVAAKEQSKPVEEKQKPVKDKASAEIIEKTKIEKPKEAEKKPETKKEENKKKIDKQKTIVEAATDKKSDKDMDSLLKNLEKASKGEKEKSKNRILDQGEKAEQYSKGTFDENKALSNDIKNLIKQQLQKLWSPPVGAQNIEQASIHVLINMDKEGNILEVKVLKKICPSVSATTCQALVESVERAVMQASPIQGLPQENYNSWKEIKFEFSPKDL